MEIQDIIQGLTQLEINAINSPEANTLIVNQTLGQAVIYVGGVFKQASFESTDDIPEGTNKFASSSDLSQISNNATDIIDLQNNKEDSFSKNTAFNKPFGSSPGTILEGDTDTITQSQASDISSNTNKRHDAVTKQDTSNVEITLTNQEIQADLTDSGVTPGSYTIANVTVDSKGRVVSISDGNGGGNANISDIAISQGNLIQSVLNAPNLTSNINNWNPTGFDANTDLIRVDVNSNNIAITGIVAPLAGVNRILGVKNINTTSLDIRFSHNNNGSIAENRFLCRDNTNKSIKPNEMALWFYDHIIQRWTPFNRIG